MPPHRAALRAVLLDVDGTLLDSNDAHAHAWRDAIAKVAGTDVPPSRLRTLIGKGGDKVLSEVLGVEDDSDLGMRIVSERKAAFKRDYLPFLRAFPGARKLLERMKAEGLQLVVATSASGDELTDLLGGAGIRDLIDASATSSDAERSKPDSDIVHAALARAKLPPDAVLMLGDTPYDVEAARKARVDAVAFRCGGWSDEALSGALARYDGPADLLACYADSPFARPLES